MNQLERFNRSVHARRADSRDHTVRFRSATSPASAAAMLWPQTRLDMSPVRHRPVRAVAVAANARSGQRRKTPARTGPDVCYGASHDPRGRGRSNRLATAPRITRRARCASASFPSDTPTEFRVHSAIPGTVLVDGARCAIVGRIAMNMSFIDLTNAPKVDSGSRVTLIGRDGENEITADDWGEWDETINYEIVIAAAVVSTRTVDAALRIARNTTQRAIRRISRS